ncbi:MAG TPA: CNP1-like family protein [Burkholderiales bacterium]|nr:CNP1-like family protein [Burkholderiales bacterium]
MGTLTLRLLVAGCMLAPAVTAAQPRADLEDEDANTKLWRELEVKLPPYPKFGNTIAFDVSAASNNRFYIDPESIAVGSDGVVRYTVVVRSPGGAENISYEGIRCETREQKYYAFWRRDGTWANARSGEWRYIVSKDINRQHGVLYLDYFCPDKKKPVGSPKDIINRFKYGVPAKTTP